VKRKRIDEADTNLELHEDQVDNETTDEPVVENRLSSPTNVKRQRIDLGASRRLVFGALGLRNPKNKDDEDRLHNKLLSDAQLRPKGLLSARREPTAEQPSGVDKDEDLDAWRLKINYRAVECCHDNIELSPAPFPFQQRWDPQQQKSFSKRNKRGGQSKRAQRNQPHYYNDDSRLGMKRKRLNSIERMDNGYDDSFDRGDNDTNDGNVTLNYDDTESRHGDQDNEPGNGTSQTTDIDDLPSLPTGTCA
jgi:hypothetical protein